MLDRGQFTFYASFRESLKLIKDPEARALAYDIICDYALYGSEPSIEDLPSEVAIIITLVLPTLAAGRRKAEGGSAKDTDKMPQRSSKDTDKMPQRSREQERERDRDIDRDIKKESIEKEKPRAAARLSPPSTDEVAAYCKERGNNVNAEAFVSFYESIGWKVGNKPMKDWKAAVRTWEQREDSVRKTKPEHPPNRFHNFDERRIDYDAIVGKGAM